MCIRDRGLTGDDPFEENQDVELRKTAGRAVSPAGAAAAAMSTSQLSVYTPNRQNVRKVCDGD